jgi:hypothetical protein
MYMATAALFVQTGLVVIVPLCFNCTVERPEGAIMESDVCFVGIPSGVEKIVTICRYAALIAMYAGFTAVVVAIFLMEHPKDPELTPPIPPAMQCLINLAVQYFLVYTMLFIFMTVYQFSGGKMGRWGVGIFDAAQKTVMFAPMLSILFLAVRMRATQLCIAEDGTIPKEAGPQLWVQEAMYLATWSVLIQLLSVITVGVLEGQAPRMDKDGNVITPNFSKKWGVPGRILGLVLETIKYVCLISMYFGALVIMSGIYAMTPEKLPPYGEQRHLIRPGGRVDLGPEVPIARPASAPSFF